jgi:hypothetical protein
MNTIHIAIATMTWARNDAEEALLRRSLGLLAGLGMPVFVTDGGSPAPFLDFLRGLPQVTMLSPPKPGLWMQTRTSLRAAYDAGTPFVLYTEPDKADFFAEFLPQLLAKIAPGHQLGVRLFSRSDEGFASFPAFQQMTETTINACCREVIGAPLDYVYGPFLLNRSMVPHLETLPETIGWGWRPYAFNVARRLGYRVEGFTGDFRCPADQREDTPTERIYRMRQLVQNIEGLTLSTAAILAT